MTETRGYIFDYGGTLDTGGCHWGKTIWHAYQQVGVPVGEAQFREAYVYAERMLGRNPIIQPDFTFRQTLEEKLRIELDYLSSALSAPSSYIQPLASHLYASVLRHTAHSREVLQQLCQTYPLVLVSNFYGNMPTVLREFGFDGLFAQVVESAVVGIRKPDSRIFLLGVEALGLQPSEVTVVGDSMEKDIIPAKKAGCQTVWLRGEQWTDAPVDASLADCVVDDLSEIITNLKTS